MSNTSKSNTCHTCGQVLPDVEDVEDVETEEQARTPEPEPFASLWQSFTWSQRIAWFVFCAIIAIVSIHEFNLAVHP